MTTSVERSLISLLEGETVARRSRSRFVQLSFQQHYERLRMLYFFTVAAEGEFDNDDTMTILQLLWTPHEIVCVDGRLKEDNYFSPHLQSLPC